MCKANVIIVMLGTMIFSVREKIAIIKSSNLSRNSVILNLKIGNTRLNSFIFEM